ncbi:NADH-quinone oxidoreductase subunit G [Demequina sp. SYSU T00039]|uniref:NADH-quinone oxidoreductase subunit G n=1 Tax=Demequina lignilytica TaxID=3051663 RepID=A0AAW7MA09_9MICO|nr:MULTISPECIES: NADH-quinone oxidoreductase subunit G [unclassified Demequina]MDN4478039.1 NADH-quinone oxidoreductase subunit G [Demequina sp. SYSU T00039-1]MDN4488511.1 NADH-quinone oxidoreductase subunit G [Demequina sp. SYSU T00039]MDN4489942.1 NADH-quinone oxidoreductase subunit G [Demequina sp. SYSU T00068]
MTATADKPAAEAVETVTLTIDGTEVTVPKGTLIIRAAEQIGIEIPRFCDHPALKPAGACRQCLVDVASPGPDGNLRAFPKPQASCTMTVTNGMVVNTQHTSEEADRAQKGVMELLLINHPLDCPVCDKGGECPLQNQAMSHGRPESRFVDVKRVFEKPLALSSEILLDRERCVLCQRCTRFSKEIAGDAFIDLQNRGAQQQIGTFDEDVLDFDGYRPVGAAAEDEAGKAFSSYYSGNTVQICPVGALTSAAYRFRSRPFDLVSSPAISEHDSSGSAIRIDHRRGKILRRLADNDPVVNEDWITDKDRFAFAWQNLDDRLARPLVRKDGELVEVSWPEALAAAAAGIRAATAEPEEGDARTAGVLVGGRVTLEDAYAYAKLARTVLGTNDVDSRARAASDEEQAFLGSAVAGTGMGVTFGDLEKAPTVLMVGFEPEDEGGVVFLRLRKSLGRQQVLTVAPFLSRGAEKLAATLVPTAPGQEAAALSGLADDAREALSQPGAVIVLGERVAESAGGFTAAQELAAATGARLAWIPRRAGERGAVEAGALPGLLPGGRAASSKAARAAVAEAWGVDSLPEKPGRDTAGILAAAAAGEIGALVVGGVSASDLAADVPAALDAVDFVVSLEVRRSDIASRADVVLPVAPPSEKSGTFVNWEGRLRSFATAIRTDAMSDHRVLDLLARELGAALGTGTVEAVNSELAALGAAGTGERAAAPKAKAAKPAKPAKGQAALATWHQLVDEGALQAGEPYLAGTGRVAVARLSQATADALGVARTVTVASERGAIELPAVVTDMVDGVIWLPLKSPGSWVARDLGASAGATVSVKGAE